MRLKLTQTPTPLIDLSEMHAIGKGQIPFWKFKGAGGLDFKKELPPISFLTIEGRAAANPPPSI